MRPSVPKLQTKPKTVNKHSIDHCSCKVNICCSFLLIFLTIHMSTKKTELLSNMQHSVPCSKNKVKWLMKKIPRQLIWRIYSIYYLLSTDFLKCIPGIPRWVFLGFCDPSTMTHGAPMKVTRLLSSGPSHERTHPCECHHRHHPTNQRVPGPKHPRKETPDGHPVVSPLVDQCCVELTGFSSRSSEHTP